MRINKFMRKYGKYIDEQTPHHSHKYGKVIVGTDSNCGSCWLRDLVSKNVTKDFKYEKYAGDFYDSSIGGRTNFLKVDAIPIYNYLNIPIIPNPPYICTTFTI